MNPFVGEAGVVQVEQIAVDGMELRFVDLSGEFGYPACAFLDVASNLFLVGANGSVFSRHQDMPSHREDIGRRMRALVPPRFFTPVGSTISYRCRACGAERPSGPMPPPPALGIYPLPEGWRLLPNPSPVEDDWLNCGCRPDL
jgi:hypothetical protein